MPCHDEHVDEKKNQNRYRKERCDVDGTDHQCVCRDQRVALSIGYAMPAHEHAVRIDAVRRAGHKSAVISGFEYLQITQVRGLNDADLIHLISNRPVEDRHGKCISGSHLIQIREQSRAWQTPVAGYDAVRTLTADRQRRAGQMPDRDLEYRFIRTVIDRQRYVDLGDFNIPHNPGTVDIELIQVFFFLGRRHRPQNSGFRQLLIVFLCRFQDLVVFIFIEIRDRVHVGSHRSRLME